MLISLQTLIKTFVCNIIIDLSYNLSKHIQYKHIWKLSEVNCLHQHTVIAFYRLDRNEKLLKFLRILIKAMYFKDRNWISKTMYCISCSMVCKIVFCSEFSDVPDKASRKARKRRRTQFYANAIRCEWRYLEILSLDLNKLNRTVFEWNAVVNEKEGSWFLIQLFDLFVASNVKWPKNGRIINNCFSSTVW